MGEIVGLVFVLAAVAFIVFLFYKSAQGFKEQKKIKQAKAATSIRLGSTMNSTLKHVKGLPFASGVLIDVYCGPSKIVFKKDGQEVSVSREKITGIDVSTGSNIQSQLAGAAAGKYVFGGTMGAAIGSLAATTIYLVISYVSEGEAKFIMLDTYMSGSFAYKLEKDFARTGSARSSSIEL